jgi:hypothetical protein
MCKVFVAFLNIYCQVKWRLGEGKWEVGRREKGEGSGFLKFDEELIILLKTDLV